MIKFYYKYNFQKRAGIFNLIGFSKKAGRWFDLLTTNQIIDIKKLRFLPF